MEKKILIVLIFISVLLTVGLCIAKPKMHKPFSLNVIDYFIKINSDGQTETVKTITTYGQGE